ncbi:hypothetical protein HOF92_10730, partial [bacterium]|nr:hypothetical protein [bacterium]
LEYSQDGGQSWTIASPVQGTPALDNMDPGTNYLIDWDTSVLFPEEHSGIIVRIIADNGAVSPPSDPFEIDNLEEGITTISKPAVIGESSALAISFDLDDTLGDPHSLYLEYSEDGVNWIIADPGTYTPELSDLSPGTGIEFQWDSTIDFPENYCGIRVRLRADDGTLSPPSDPFDIINNPDIPVVVLISKPTVTGSSGSVTITYGMTDTSGASHGISLEYTSDGGQTYSTSIPIIGDDLSSTAPAPGLTLAWDTSTQIPGNLAGIQVRVVADGSIYSPLSDPFIISNEPVIPKVTEISKPAVSGTSSVLDITYSLNDTTGENRSLTLQYSVDGGLSWTGASPTTGLPDLADVISGQGHSIAWDSRILLPAEHSGIIVRIIADNGAISPPSDPFDLDNRILGITTISKPDVIGNAGTVAITFDLDDTVGNPHSLRLEYSDDGGTTWIVADSSTYTPALTDLSPGTGDSFDWNTEIQLPGNFTGVRVRLRADDGTLSPPSDSFEIINDPQIPAEVLLSKPVLAGTEGTVLITYDLTDDDQGSHAISLEYTSDGGTTWMTAVPISGTNLENTSPGEGLTLGWDTTQQIPGNLTGVQVRVVADGVVYSPPSDPAVIANEPVNPGYTEISKPSVGGTEGIIPITYSLVDTTGTDRSLTLQFSLDGGISWSTASPVQGIPPLLKVSPGIAHLMVWDTTILFPSDITQVVVRIIADNGAVSPPSDPFDILNGAGTGDGTGDGSGDGGSGTGDGGGDG